LSAAEKENHNVHIASLLFHQSFQILSTLAKVSGRTVDVGIELVRATEEVSEFFSVLLHHPPQVFLGKIDIFW
jgi:hypothetical protein